MKDWALQHPYLTFFMALFAMATVSSTFTSLFGRPAVKVPDKPKEQKEPVIESDPNVN